MTTYQTESGIPIAVATLSRIGSRRKNEDACGYWVTDAGYCFVVSDGAGGHVGGAVASEIAVKAVLTDYAANPGFSAEAVSRCTTSAWRATTLFVSPMSASRSYSSAWAAAMPPAKSESANPSPRLRSRSR